MNTLIIDCSPRKAGNSDIVTEHIATMIDGVNVVRLRDYDFTYCDGCGYCDSAKVCKYDDDATMLYGKLSASDVVIFVAPVYFFGFDGHTKSFIDRAQYLWSSRSSERSKKLYLIAIGGQKHITGYEGMVHTLQCYGINIGATFEGGIYLGQVDAKGEVEGRLGEVDSFVHDIKNQLNI